MESRVKQSHRVSLWSAVAGVLVLVLASASLVLGGLAQAQEPSQDSVMYAENGTGPVLTLSASDPEGVGPIVWSILQDEGGVQDLGIVQAPEDAPDDVADTDVADRASFGIKDGVLTFKSPPSYEDNSDSGDKTYRVVVQASDGGTGDEQLSWFKVVVTVTDEEEDGKVSWTVDHNNDDSADTPRLMQFQAGASLTASVTDDDVTDADKIPDNIRWQWYRSSSKTSMDTAIDGATSETYTASDTSTSNDVGMYLHAMATYSDRRGSNKTASALVSDYPVQAARKDNSVPKFPSAAATRGYPRARQGGTSGPLSRPRTLTAIC